MKLYWSGKRIPELAVLSKEQRRHVLEAWWGYHRYEHAKENTVVSFLLMFATMGLNALFTESLHLPFFVGMIAAVAVLSVPMAIYHCVNLARLSRNADMFIRQTLSGK
jgi:hypothetical protein